MVNTIVLFPIIFDFIIEGTYQALIGRRGHYFFGPSV